MTEEEFSVDSLDSYLIDLQIGEVTLEGYSHALMKPLDEELDLNNNEEQTANKEGISLNNGNRPNTPAPNKEQPTRASRVTDDDQTIRNNIGSPSPATIGKGFDLKETHLQELKERVNKILAEGGGVDERSRSPDLPYIGVTQSQSELLLQHGEFPATPIAFPSGPKYWSTPLVYAAENGRTTTRDYYNNGPCHPIHQNVRLAKSTGYSGTRNQTSWMRGDVGMTPKQTGAAVMTTPENFCNYGDLPKWNWSTGGTLPSIMSWGGDGEAAWSTMSQASSRWASAISEEPSVSGVPSIHFSNVSGSNFSGSNFSLSQSEADKHIFNQEVYFEPDARSCSNPEIFERDERWYRGFHPNKTTGNQLLMGELQSHSVQRPRNRFYPYPGYKTIFNANEDPYRKSRGGQPNQVFEGAYAMNFNKEKIKTKNFGKSFCSKGVQRPTLVVESPKQRTYTLTGQISPQDCVQRTSPKKALLQDIVLKESNRTFRSHALFPLLHDLAVADYYYHTAEFDIGALLNLMPTSTDDLVTMFLQRNPERAYLVHSGVNDNMPLDILIKDAIAFAHSSIFEKIRNRPAKDLTLAKETEREAAVEKMCYEYMDAAVRSSTPLHRVQTIGSTSLRNSSSDPLLNLEQILQPLSPISTSQDASPSSSTVNLLPFAASTSTSCTSNSETPYTNEVVDILSKWLRKNKNTYPDDDQKAQLMTDTGLNSKEVTDWFVSEKINLGTGETASTPSTVH